MNDTTRKLVAACRALRSELQCYTAVHTADEDDERAIALAAHAIAQAERPQPDNEDAQEILAILKPAHMEILEQRTKLLAACRALVRQLKCYAVDEEDVQALTLAAEAMRGLS